MPPFLILIIQYGLQYGLPAMQQLIAMFEKSKTAPITLDDWNKLFDLSKQPIYGQQNYVWPIAPVLITSSPITEPPK